MKKYFKFIFFCLVLIILFIYISHKPRDYETEYKLNGAIIQEKYSKKEKYYYFTINYKDISYRYIYRNKYDHTRNLITKLDIKEKKDNICVTPKIDNKKLDTICHNGSYYLDSYLANISDKVSEEKQETVNNVDIYDKGISYLLWNKKGLLNLNTKKNLEFLKNEAYDNPLSYKLNEYILIPDYDSKREFNKFYIYDNKDNKISSWEFDYKISFNSYFMGDIDDDIYLFDTKNKVQYKINIRKRKISITSDKEGALYYDDKWDMIDLNKLQYKEIKFKQSKYYNFIIKDNNLYMHFINIDDFIKISDKKITSIVLEEDNKIYYLVDEKLYMYEVGKGEKLLLVNFEWNFSHLNKIFIFD